eukprot:1155993-Pelagomonas_calceolata.AAC.21
MQVHHTCSPHLPASWLSSIHSRASFTALATVSLSSSLTCRCTSVAGDFLLQAYRHRLAGVTCAGTCGQREFSCAVFLAGSVFSVPFRSVDGGWARSRHSVPADVGTIGIFMLGRGHRNCRHILLTLLESQRSALATWVTSKQSIESLLHKGLCLKEHASAIGTGYQSGCHGVSMAQCLLYELAAPHDASTQS